jgi:hypothetical protein
MGHVVLEIKNLTRRFGVFAVVAAMPLSVNAGRVFRVWQRKAQPGLQNDEFSNFLSRKSRTCKH